MEKLDRIRFKSEQRFLPLFVRLTMIGIIVYMFYRVVLQLFCATPLGDSPMSNSGLILFYILLLFCFILFIQLKLIVIIDDISIQISFAPIYKKKILLSSVKTIEIIKYNVFSSGFRVSLRYGSILRVKGTDGLFVYTKNGNKFLIGIKETDINSLKEVIVKVSKVFNPTKITD